MATQKNYALAKLLAVLIAVILVFSSLVIGLYAYTYMGLRMPFASVAPELTPSPTPPAIATPTPTPSTSPPSNAPSTPPSNTATPVPTPTKVTLTDAISQGIVQAIFVGNDACAGECIKLTIKSQVAYPLEITPPASGTVLTTTSPEAQSMVLAQFQGIDHGSTYTPATSMLVSNQTPVTYVFRAYCLEFHKANPSSTDQFTMAGTANPDVVKVLNAVGTLPALVTSIEAVQTAIWVVTDNVSPLDLNEAFPSGASEISNAKTILQAAGIDTTNKALFTASAST